MKILGFEAEVYTSLGGWKHARFKTNDGVYVKVSYYARYPRTQIHASLEPEPECLSKPLSVTMDLTQECGDIEVLRAIKAVRVMRGDKI
jgi:hypothetical protein